MWTVALCQLRPPAGAVPLRFCAHGIVGVREAGWECAGLASACGAEWW